MGQKDFLQELERRAHEMRETPTPAESAFANALRKASVECEQQKVIAGRAAAIADFYIPKLKLVIEVDGHWHNEYEQYRSDLQRSANVFKEIGALVLRIPNEAALSPHSSEGVASLIATAEPGSLETLERSINEQLVRRRTKWAAQWLLHRFELQSRLIREEFLGIGPRVRESKSTAQRTRHPVLPRKHRQRDQNDTESKRARIEEARRRFFAAQPHPQSFGDPPRQRGRRRPRSTRTG